MELQIQDLVSSIRKEGIDQANMEAESIIAEAKKKAEAIVADARTEAARTKEASEKEIATLRESAVVSAEQAKRDAMLAFKAEVQAAYERLLSAKIRSSFSGESLGKLIRAAAEGEEDFTAADGAAVGAHAVGAAAVKGIEFFCGYHRLALS